MSLALVSSRANEPQAAVNTEATLSSFIYQRHVAALLKLRVRLSVGDSFVRGLTFAVHCLPAAPKIVFFKDAHL